MGADVVNFTLAVCIIVGVCLVLLMLNVIRLQQQLMRERRKLAREAEQVLSSARQACEQNVLLKDDISKALALLSEVMPILNACIPSYDADSNLPARIRAFITHLQREPWHGWRS